MQAFGAGLLCARHAGLLENPADEGLAKKLYFFAELRG